MFLCLSCMCLFQFVRGLFDSFPSEGENKHTSECAVLCPWLICDGSVMESGWFNWRLVPQAQENVKGQITFIASKIFTGDPVRVGWGWWWGVIAYISSLHSANFVNEKPNPNQWWKMLYGCGPSVKMCMTVKGLQVWLWHVWSPMYAFLLSQIKGWGEKSLSSLNCNVVSLAALPVKYERERDWTQYNIKKNRKWGESAKGHCDWQRLGMVAGHTLYLSWVLILSTEVRGQQRRWRVWSHESKWKWQRAGTKGPLNEKVSLQSCLAVWCIGREICKRESEW